MEVQKMSKKLVAFFSASGVTANAAKILADREITVKTWLDRETLDAVIGSYNAGEGKARARFGAAVTDKEGHLPTCYSDTKANDNYNNVTKPAIAG